MVGACTVIRLCCIYFVCDAQCFWFWQPYLSNAVIYSLFGRSTWLRLCAVSFQQCCRVFIHSAGSLATESFITWFVLVALLINTVVMQVLVTVRFSCDYKMEYDAWTVVIGEKLKLNTGWRMRLIADSASWWKKMWNGTVLSTAKH